MSKARWSEAEEDALRKLWIEGLHDREIAETLGRPEAGVYKRRIDLGLCRRRKLARNGYQELA